MGNIIGNMALFMGEIFWDTALTMYIFTERGDLNCNIFSVRAFSHNTI